MKKKPYQKPKPKKKDRLAVSNCGGKKCGSAFEWTCKDFIKQIKANV